MIRRLSNESDDTVGHSSHDGSYDGMNQRRQRKDKKQIRIRKLMTSLQLPQLRYRETPSLRILVVANVDLDSASKLAEAALLPDPDNPLRHVDLCLACGPFCRADELNTYYQGRQLQLRSRYYHPGQQQSHHALSPPPVITSPYKNQQYPHKSPKRTREETAALEGLMTAALSQLESIVCRVLYIPGETDPTCRKNKRRLTPNSRNLHRHWMPLSPGLGCAGLLHIDWDKYKEQEEDIDEEDNEYDDDEGGEEVDDDDMIHQSLPPLEDNELSDSVDSEVDDSSSNEHDASGELPPRPTPVSPGSLRKVYRYDSCDSGMNPHHSLAFNTSNIFLSFDYCKTLVRLVHSAPPLSAVTDMPKELQSHPTICDLQKTELFQSILVTQYQHLKGTKDTGLGPLPPDHEAFCALPIVQEHVALEIAAGLNGRGEIPSPSIEAKGRNMKLLFPGSLKDRGEYCLVDIAFLQNDNYECEWSVQRTQFLNL
eukprot:scaffold620_cov103-Cylindrotheca_fusiformis.AAC.2